MNEIEGIGVSVCFWFETALTANGIASECQDVGDPHEVEVDQCIFRFLYRKAAADDVGHRFHLIPVEQGRTNADRSWAFSDGSLLEQSRPHFAVHVFLTVVSDIHECRVEWHQRIHGPINGIDVLPFQRGQYFHAETTVGRIGEDFCDVHVVELGVAAAARCPGWSSSSTGDSHLAVTSGSCPRLWA